MPLQDTSRTPFGVRPLLLEPVDGGFLERRVEYQTSRTCSRRTTQLSDLRSSRIDLASTFAEDMEASDDSDLEDAAILASIAGDDDY